VKSCLNGAVVIGSRNAANIEISGELGEENIFMMGLSAEEIAALGPHYNPLTYINNNPDLARILEQIKFGYFCPLDPTRYSLVWDSLTQSDPYFLMADFKSYIFTQNEVDVVQTLLLFRCFFFFFLSFFLFVSHSLVIHHCSSFCFCQQAYLDRKRWTKISIRNVARIGKFSSDRSTSDYAANIWHIEPVLQEGSSQAHHVHTE
jgi:starch phosphorylase